MTASDLQNSTSGLVARIDAKSDAPIDTPIDATKDAPIDAPKDAPPVLRVIVVPHTHWDREWYLTQCQFQFLLGDTLDGILDVLENKPRFHSFTADGQTSIVEDYLEIRPQRRQQVEQFIREGRLKIGPWYTMPDLWLCSGEGVIRNLMRGRLDCERLGVEPQGIGYVPDSFGHIEQMPQILQGFGIDNYFFSRGRPEDPSKELAEKNNHVEDPSIPIAFWWEAPDGVSRILAHHLPSGYLNATLLPADDLVALRRRLTSALLPYQNADLEFDAVPLFNGTDHIWVQKDLPEILDAAGKLLPDVAFEIGSLEEFQRSINHSLLGKSLPTFSGCLRSLHLRDTDMHGTWSSRIDNKIEHAHASAFLEGMAEPAAAMLAMAGGPLRRHELARAWTGILHSQAHDSICGCSADAVHRDVSQRFRQSEEISEMVVTDALRKIHGTPEDAWLIRMAGLGGADDACQWSIDTRENQVVGLEARDGVPIPCQLLSTRHLRCRDFVLDVPHAGMPGLEQNERGMVEFVEQRIVSRLPALGPAQIEQYRVVVRDADELREIDEHDETNKPDKPNGLDTPVARYASDASDASDALDTLDALASPAVFDPVTVEANALENQTIRIEASRNGTIRLMHKPSGLTYSGLLELTDEADAGGGYFFAPIEDGQIERSSTCDFDIRIVEQGPVRGVLSIRGVWDLPANLNEGGMSRHDERTPCDIDLQITLVADSEQVNCRMKFNNRVIAHRVRMQLPLPFETHHADVERAFTVAREDLNRFQAEPGQDTHPMRNWVAVSGERGGLAFVGRGLHEYALSTESAESVERVQTTMQITLLRSVSFVDKCGTWRTPDAELRRELEYDFALLPFSGTWREGQVAQRAARFVHQSVVETMSPDLRPWCRLPHATVGVDQWVEPHWVPVSSHRSPWQKHFGERDGWRRVEQTPALAIPDPPLSISGCDVLISCIKLAERAIGGGDDDSSDLIIRFYSVAEESQTVRLHFANEVTQAWVADLTEEPGMPLAISSEGAQMLVAPFQIRTIRCRTSKC